MTAETSEYKIEITCPGTDATLHLERGTIQERLGTPFEMNLSLYCEDKEIDLGKLLGEELAVHVTTTKEERWFHGVVCHFSAVGYSERYGHYQAVVRPKLWLLGQAARCRVFESMSVTDIVKKSLQGGAVDIGKAAASKVKFEHCVQYRETDLHFVSRLMERHGLYYFFGHTEKKHTVEIAGSMSDHEDVGAFEYDAEGSSGDEFQIEEWRATTTLRTGGYRVEGTENLTRSAIDAKGKTRFDIAAAGDLQVDDFEAVDEYAEPHLDELARVRMQAIDATVEEYTGTTRTTKIAAGNLFSLEKHPRADQNRKYLVTAAVYQLEGDLPDGKGASDDPFVMSFTAIDAKTPYSPPIVHHKPRVQGPHLATVVDETDEYGRVTVKFHWGNPDGEIQSCRARVSQNWAGQEWGGVFLPHVGHEVIVEFLDGDPDQPLVTGRVYNKESMPPLSLPGDKQKSIIRDHGGNEIVMDGTDGSQTITMFCPKHESRMTLGKSVELESISDFKNAFLGSWIQDIKKDYKALIGGNVKEVIHGDVLRTVAGQGKLKMGGNVMEHFLGWQVQILVGYFRKMYMARKVEVIKGSQRKKILGEKHERVTGKVYKDGTQGSESWDEHVLAVKKEREERIEKLKQTVKDTVVRNWNKATTTVNEKLDKLDDWKTECTGNIVQSAESLTNTVSKAVETSAKTISNKASSAYKWVANKVNGNNGDFTMKD